MIVDSLDEINENSLKKARLFDGFFRDDEWGGVNCAYTLKNGLIGCIGHESYATHDTDGAKSLHYYGMAFALNPDTLGVYGPKIIISRDCFPSFPPKRESLADVTFTAGIVRENGRIVLYSGLSDSAVGSAYIENPFEEYENI
jgi:hypothetical protein